MSCGVYTSRIRLDTYGMGIGRPGPGLGPNLMALRLILGDMD